MRATDLLYTQALRDAARLSATVDMVDLPDRTRLYDQGLQEEASRARLMKLVGLGGSRQPGEFRPAAA
jgi:hypothetical protein